MIWAAVCKMVVGRTVRPLTEGGCRGRQTNKTTGGGVMKNVMLVLLVGALSLSTGCATVIGWIEEYIHPKPVPEQEFPEGMVWLHPSVENWEVTAKLKSVSFNGRYIVLDYDKANTWPAHDFGDMQLNANPWVIVNRDGKYYAATWEWMRKGQTSKFASAVNGDHIKRRELNDWAPEPGEELQFFLSGLIRGPQRNVSERSNVVKIKWPSNFRATEAYALETRWSDEMIAGDRLESGSDQVEADIEHMQDELTHIKNERAGLRSMRWRTRQGRRCGNEV